MNGLAVRPLPGITLAVRTVACPACGCYTLQSSRGRAVCVNRHCAPGEGLARRWSEQDLRHVVPRLPRGVARSTGYPADLMGLDRLAGFFAETGRPLAAEPLGDLIEAHLVPGHVTYDGAVLYSRSDAATVHALHVGLNLPVHGRPACAGRADLFFNTDEAGAAAGMGQPLARRRIARAKELCGACPLRTPCLEFGLVPNDSEQHGVQGGLTSTERRDLRVAHHKAEAAR